MFKDKTILITGGTGTIGSAICRKLLKFNPKQVRIYSRDDTKQFNLSEELENFKNVRYLIGDVRDRDRLFRATEGVDYIFHVAALKHVGICEYNPFEAIKTNVIGTENAIDAAIKYNVDRFLLISTDKATNPTNTMGATKLLAERLTVSANLHKGHAKTNFSVVRFGNVLFSRGSVVPLFIKQIREKKEITITDPYMTRFIMTIDQAADFVISSMISSIGGEIFIKKMKSVNIGFLADTIIKTVSRSLNIESSQIKKRQIGFKAGERKHEILFTTYESHRCYEMEDKYVIIPEHYLKDKNYTQYHKYPKTKVSELTSDKVEQICENELEEMLQEYIKRNRIC